MKLSVGKRTFGFGSPLWLRAAGFGVAYFLCANLGWWLSNKPQSFANFWLPSGLFVAGLLLNPPRAWPSFVLAACAGNIVFDLCHGHTLILSLLFCAGNSAEALAGAWLVRRFVSKQPRLETVREVLGFVAFSALGSTLLSAAAGAAAVTRFAGAAFGKAWAMWWSGDVTGVLVVAPLLLIPWTGKEGFTRFKSPKLLLEAAAIVACTLLGAWFAIDAELHLGIGLKYLVLPFIGWAAIRFGACGVAVTMPIVALVFAWQVSHIAPADAVHALPAFMPTVAMQAFLSVTAITGLLLGVAVAERRRREEALRESEDKYRRLHESMTDAFVGVDMSGCVQEFNRAYREMLGYTGEEIRSLTYVDLTPEKWHEMEANLVRDQILPRGFSDVYAKEYRRKDGTVFPVELRTFLMRDKAGQPASMWAIVRDITERKRVEAALQESESHFRQMLGSVTDYVYRVDYEEDRPRSTTHGPGCQSVTGYAPEDYAANPYLWFEMIHPEDHGAVEQHASRILRGEISEPLEHRIIHKNGSVRWVRNTLLPRRDSAGRLISCDGMIADITERKAAERALARDEAELSAIYEHAPAMMCLLSVDGRVRRLNRATLDFAGGSNDDAAGKGPGDFMGCVEALKRPEGCGHGPACPTCPLRTALLDTARNGVTHRRVESTLHLQRNGRAREMVVLASTARVEVGGETLMLLCLEDITSQKEAEARIRQQAALLDQTQDAVLVASLDTLLRYCNHSAEQFFGQPAAELLNQSVETLMFSSAPELCAEACQTTLEKGTWAGETRAAGSVGNRTLTSRWTLIRDAAGRPASYLIVNTDVTEQKRMEEQSLRSQRMESIGTLASGIAHDLNNILTPILIATEVLRPMAKGPDEEEVIDMLRKGAQRGADIIRQLLMFGRGVEGQRSDLQPRTLLKEMLKVLKETFPKALTLEHSFPENLWMIHADPTQVHQVLLNLCVNARDAMPRGGTLTLSAENLVMDEHYAATNLEAKPGPYVVLEVGDTGTGIPPEIMHKIFDPFFTTKEPGQGTGLGLSTVLGIVKSHGGFTRVNSRPGEGTRFKVYFPALEEQKDPQAAKVAPRPPRGHGELILVVDDEESIRAVAQRVLVKFGYRVITAADGADGLVTFSRHKRDVVAVVVDMVMPVMDGAALIRSLRHLSPGLRIIAMSGLAAQQEEAEKAGVSAGAFLIKPFAPEALLILLRKTLAERKTA